MRWLRLVCRCPGEVRGRGGREGVRYRGGRWWLRLVCWSETRPPLTSWAAAADGGGLLRRGGMRRWPSTMQLMAERLLATQICEGEGEGEGEGKGVRVRG